MKEKMFGFEIKQQSFGWTGKRPTPPPGYVEFNSNRAHCQAGKCPNCGVEKPGTGPGKRNGGFQDREIQNLWRNLERMNQRLDVNHPHWKPSYDLFSKDLLPEKGKMNSMIKCHPSRYGIAEFSCCSAQIWHDFHDGDTGWKYYYKPTKSNQNTLQKWF